MAKEPIQLWLPLINFNLLESSVSRDIERAQNEWNGEYRIWFIPGLKEVTRWVHKSSNRIGFSEVAIPSENINSITVHHIDNQNHIFPPIKIDDSSASWNKIPDNLFRQWLNVGEPDLVPGKKKIKINLPVIKDNNIKYKEKDVSIKPGPFIPVENINNNKNELKFLWPPAGKDNDFIKPISPETESLNEFGELTWENENSSNNVAILEKNDNKAINLWLKWPQPFNQILPIASGIDLIFHRSIMKKCVEQLKINQTKSKNIISSNSNKFTTEGWTTKQQCWIEPRYLNQPRSGILMDIEGKFDISVDSFRELYNHDKYVEIFQNKIPINRVMGWEGYFWWELDNLINKEYKNVMICEKCGDIIMGRADKKYCNKKDNPKCYRDRMAKYKRKERSK